MARPGDQRPGDRVPGDRVSGDRLPAAHRPALPPVDPPSDPVGNLVRGGIGVARVGMGVGLRVAAFGVRTSARFAARVVAAGRDGGSPAAVVAETVRDLRTDGRELLGLDPAEEVPSTAQRRSRVTPDVLRARATWLLRQSVDIDYEEPVHPAWLDILDAITPDEARILRHLRDHGPVAMVDVRSQPLAGTAHTEAEAVTLVGELAGCRWADRVPGYLVNLQRLGLVDRPTDPLPAAAYEMLEAQPAVQDALRRSRRGTTVRRQVRLTPFGADLCAACLPTDPVA